MPEAAISCKIMILLYLDGCKGRIWYTQKSHDVKMM
jgi:hypothetical protein